MKFLADFFQFGPLPACVLQGYYHPGLVLLSYSISILAPFLALDLACIKELRPHKPLVNYWLLLSSFTLGSGIWSMHFIAMLAYIMPMPMSYGLSSTIISLLISILASGAAFYLLNNHLPSLCKLLMGSAIMGLGIVSMHYVGMYSMRGHVAVHYVPSLFLLSVSIALLASFIALWIVTYGQGWIQRWPLPAKFLSALMLSVAISGMHYTGMAAAILTPSTQVPNIDSAVINPYYLATMIAMVMLLVMGIILSISIYTRMLNAMVQKQRDFLGAMLNHLSDVIIACDQRGKVTVCNSALKRYFKPEIHFSSAQLPEYMELIPVAKTMSITSSVCPLKRALEGELIMGQEYIMRIKASEPRHVAIDGQPIMSDDQQLGAVIIIHDITELKQTEKLKKEFVAIVSHELRTPLTAIRGALTLLLGGMGDNISGRMRTLLDIANKNTERLIRLINDILDIEKIEAGKMAFNFSLTDLNQVILTSMREIQTLAEHSDIQFDYTPVANIHIRADHDRLMQVMINLLSNAIHFSPPNKKITIRLEQSTRYVRISVIDQGEGIPKEFASHIFQKFSQVDSSASRKKGGTGLGLSICKAIIEKHHGVINFTSQPRKGTCFYFELPKQGNIDFKG